MYDLVIIGGGPAGVAAGVYAARKRLKTLLITESFGGQSVESVGIENWIGTERVPGPDFAKMLERHLRAIASDVVEIDLGNKVTKVSKAHAGFEIETEKSKHYLAKTVLVATGSTRRRLEIPGAKEFENKGITYCASCDGPLFAGLDVAVIGGGNAALESSAQLLAYCKSVTLLNRSEKLRGDEVTIEKISKDPKMNILTNAIPKEIRGEKFVTSIIYTENGEEKELKVAGIFVEIGLIPTTWFVDGVVEMNQYKQVKVDPKTQRTSAEGLWAAGDSTDGLYHQNNIAAGDAVKALEDIYLYLKAR